MFVRIFFCRQSSASVHHFMFLYVENFLPLLKTNQTVLVLYFYLCWFVKTPPPVPGNFSPPRLPPITTPPSPRHTHKPSISTSETEKAIDNHATTFCCRLRPIRANHSTVGVVARRLFCVWFVAAWVRGAWPARPLPAPWLCLAVLALKGRRHTIGFTHLINRPIKNQSALISSTRKKSHRSSVLSERPRLSVDVSKASHGSNISSFCYSAAPSSSHPLQLLIFRILKVTSGP